MVTQNGSIIFLLLTFFHSFANVPVDKSPFGKHEVKFVVDAGPGLDYGGCIAETAHSSVYPRQISTRHGSRWLVVDTDLKHQLVSGFCRQASAIPATRWPQRW